MMLPSVFGILMILAFCVWRAYADAPMNTNFKKWKEIKEELDANSKDEETFKWAFCILAICFILSLLI